MKKKFFATLFIIILLGGNLGMCTEFKNTEILIVAPYPHLTVKHRAPGIQLDGKSQKQEKWGGHKQNQKRSSHVKHALPGKGRPSGMELFLPGSCLGILHLLRQFFKGHSAQTPSSRNHNGLSPHFDRKIHRHYSIWGRMGQIFFS